MMKKSICVEIKKIIKSKLFLISVLLIVISTVLLTMFVNNSNKEDYSFIVKMSEEEYYKKGYKDYEKYLEKYKEYENLISNEIIKNDYILDNDYVERKDIKSYLSASYIMVVFLSIYTILISSSSFGKEYDRNTIKLLLLNSRSKKHSVISKFIALLLVIGVISIIIFCVNYITATIISHENILKITDIIVKEGKVLEKPIIIEHICEYLKLVFPQLLLIILSLFLGFLFKSSTVSGIISLFLLLSSTFITELFIKMKLRFITFTFIPYMDFSIFQNKFNLILYNIENNINLGIKNGVIIIIITSIILLILSNVLFRKREFK